MPLRAFMCMKPIRLKGFLYIDTLMFFLMNQTSLTSNDLFVKVVYGYLFIISKGMVLLPKMIRTVLI